MVPVEAKMKKFVASMVLILLCSPSWALAGTKEELIRLQQDILQLQNQVRLMQKSVEENSSILKSLLEQLNDQVAKSNLAAQALAQTVQGQKAETAGGFSQIRQDIGNLSVKWDDTNNRIAALHQKLEESQVRLNSLRALPSPAEGGDAVAPDQVYNAAYNDYLMGNYDLAIVGFRDFLSTYRDSELSDNALYYMGVAYQTLGQHEQAIQAFDQVINLYPKADKTPIAYYKKALIQQQLQKNPEAIDTFKKLLAAFPDAQEATLAKQELEKLGVNLTETPQRRR